MKKSLADGIEQYVKVLIARSEKRQIEIQRTELAETFACAPSQVTYVLSTRFTHADGYYTESRRGGMGYVRITQISSPGRESAGQEELLQLVNELGQQKRLGAREKALFAHIADHAAHHVRQDYLDQVCLVISAGLRRFMEMEADEQGGK